MQPTVVGIDAYGVLIAVAFVLAFYLTLREAERRGLDRARVYRAGIVAAVVGLVGARLYVVATHAHDYFGHPLDVLLIWKGGAASTGMYAGGLVGALSAARWFTVPAGPMLDSCAPAAALGVAVGRVACFMNGCCYGRISDAPLAVGFPAGSQPQIAHVAAGLIPRDAASLPVHPVQLYEAAYAVVLFAILWRSRRVPSRGGTQIALFFILYPLARFFTEFFRGDQTVLVGHLSVPQVFSIGAVVLAGAYLARAKLPGASAS